MFTLEGVQKLHSWTHACLSVVLDHLFTIPEGDYVKELPIFGFPSLQKQMIHIFNCEGFWVHTMQGLQFVNRTPADCPSVADARGMQQQVSGQTLAYLSSLTNQQLNTDAQIRFPDGELAIRTPALVLHHVLTHAFHHKGQIVALCRELGYPAPHTDLDQFE